MVERGRREREREREQKKKRERERERKKKLFTKPSGGEYVQSCQCCGCHGFSQVRRSLLKFGRLWGVKNHEW